MNKEKIVITEEQKTTLEECYREAILALAQMRAIFEEIGVLEESKNVRTFLS